MLRYAGDCGPRCSSHMIRLDTPMSESAEPRLVVLQDGRIADLAGAVVHSSRSGDSRLYITRRSGIFVLSEQDFSGILTGQQRTFKHLTRGDAARWMITHGIEVPPEMLEGFEIL